ncbi:MAG: hypothetical protein HQ521_20560 [Bacteroidetes bacterium]|nr:hypothetical protein [Bacteroidota bacterium]
MMYSRKTNNRLLLIVIGFTFLHEISLVLFPNIYAIFSNYYLESELGIKPIEIIRIINIELLFLIMFAIGLILSQKHFSNRYVYDKPNQIEITKKEAIFLYIIITLQLALNLVEYFKPLPDPSLIYQHADIKQHANVLNMFIYWLPGIFRFPGLIIAGYVVVSKTKYVPLKVFSYGLLVTTFFSALWIGWSGPLIWVTSVVIAASIYTGNIKYFKPAVILIVFVFVFFSFIRTDIRANSYYLEKLSFRNKISFLVNMRISNNRDNNLFNNKNLFNMADRAEGVRNSAFLLRLCDAGQSAGIKPIFSSLYFPVPRYFWKNKRPPGSIDSGNYGSAIFIVQNQKNGSLIEMGPILASAHAYWEFGLLGVIIIGALTGYFWGKVTYKRAQTSLIQYIIVMTFLCSLLIDGLFTAMYPVYSFIIIFWSVILPVYLLFYTIRKLRFL